MEEVEKEQHKFTIAYFVRKTPRVRTHMWIAYKACTYTPPPPRQPTSGPLIVEHFLVGLSVCLYERFSSSFLFYFRLRGKKAYGLRRPIGFCFLFCSSQTHSATPKYAYLYAYASHANTFKVLDQNCSTLVHKTNLYAYRFSREEEIPSSEREVKI